MEVRRVNSRLVKPVYEGDPPSITKYIPLTMFDLVAVDAHVPLIYAYRSPTPPNEKLEQALQRVLSEYREWAGRFDTDGEGRRVILLNDDGVRFVEASTNCTLDQAMPFHPSPAILLSFYPSLEGVKELAIIQLTRFTCGSIVIGISTNHMVADGYSVSQFLVAWGQACRGLEMNPRPFHDRTIFSPRDPPKFEFNHRKIEFKNKNEECPQVLPSADLFVHKVHFTSEILAKIKSKACVNNKAYNSFESLMAHLWRTITRTCALAWHESTCIKIAVNGRSRLNNPRLNNEYFGNLVLWAIPIAKVKELLCKPLSYAARLIHEAVSKVNDDYFKSFIDFANYKAREEDLEPITDWMDSNSTSLNLYVDSLLRFPFSDFDFGGGKPCFFMPSYQPCEHQLFIVPSLTGDGSIEVFIALSQHHVASFKQILLLSGLGRERSLL